MWKNALLQTIFEWMLRQGPEFIKTRLLTLPLIEDERDYLGI